jgi:hypothetical protein
MALEKTITVQDSFGENRSFTGAYGRVDMLMGNKNGFAVTFNFYKNSECAVLLQTIATSFKPSLEGNNFIAQAYEHMKTLPEVAGAKDC